MLSDRQLNFFASFSRYKLVINELDFFTDDKEWFDRISLSQDIRNGYMQRENKSQ